MNQRIRLMAKANQAFTESRVTSPEVTKFMELIVQECAKIADTAEPFLYSDLIKKHFGVEE